MFSPSCHFPFPKHAQKTLMPFMERGQTFPTLDSECPWLGCIFSYNVPKIQTYRENQSHEENFWFRFHILQKISHHFLQNFKIVNCVVHWEMPIPPKPIPSI
jgi:hypothetical protein